MADALDSSSDTHTHTQRCRCIVRTQPDDLHDSIVRTNDSAARAQVKSSDTNRSSRAARKQATSVQLDNYVHTTICKLFHLPSTDYRRDARARRPPLQPRAVATCDDAYGWLDVAAAAVDCFDVD